MIKWNIFTQILLCYGIAMILVYLVSDVVIFPRPPASYSDKTLDIVKLVTSDGKKISALYLNNPHAKYTILFSHGNAEDIGDLVPFLTRYRDKGFSILAFDYHGYGTSEGRPTEENSYHDIRAAYTYLVKQLNIPPDRIILHGRSIGTGPALELAITAPIKAIILESPMVSAFQVMTIVPIFPLDKYRNAQKMTHLKVPLLIIHGANDTIIPSWHGKRLYDIARTQKTFAPIEGAGHNDILLTAGNVYWNIILKFVGAL